MTRGIEHAASACSTQHMSGDLLHTQVDEIRKLMETRLRLHGKTLAQQVHKAGRLLPRRRRREATYLAQVEPLMHHPKLMRRVDAHKVRKAHANLSYFLKSIDPKDRAKGRVLAWLGSISFIAIVVFILVVTVLVQRGIV